MRTSEFIKGVAKCCLEELKNVDLKDPEEGGESIIEKHMLQLVVDLGIPANG